MKALPRDNGQGSLKHPKGKSNYVKNSRTQEDSLTSTCASDDTSTMQAQFRVRAEKKTVARQARTSARSRSPVRTDHLRVWADEVCVY